MAKKEKKENYVINPETLDEQGRKYFEYVYNEFNRISITKLREIAKQMGVKSATTFPKRKLVSVMTESRVANTTYCVENKSHVKAVTYVDINSLVDDFKLKTLVVNSKECDGILQVREDGAWLTKEFLSDEQTDIFVPMLIVNEYALKEGDHITGECRFLGNASRYGLFKITGINGKLKDTFERNMFLDSMPVNQIVDIDTDNMVELKAMQIISPLALGQRRLILGLNGMNLDKLAIELSTQLSKCGYDPVNIFLDLSPETTAAAQALSGKNLILSCDRYEEYDSIVKLAVAYAKNLATMGRNVFIILNGADVVSQNMLRAVFGAGRNLSRGSLTTILLAGALDLSERLNGLARNATAVTVFKNNYGDETLINIDQSYITDTVLLNEGQLEVLRKCRTQSKDRYMCVSDFISMYNVLLMQGKRH